MDSEIEKKLIELGKEKLGEDLSSHLELIKNQLNLLSEGAVITKNMSAKKYLSNLAKEFEKKRIEIVQEYNLLFPDLNEEYKSLFPEIQRYLPEGLNN